MQWIQFHQAPSGLRTEEERIDMLARRFVLTGLSFCVVVASALLLLGTTPV